MEIRLVDGSVEELPEGSSGVELSRKLKKKLNGSALATKINGRLRDLTTELNDGDEVQVLTFDDQEGKDIFWHSSAHLLAQAVQRLFPDAKPTIGPSIETGFYYDFADLQVTEDDFPKIEDEMKKIIKERTQPKRVEFSSKQDALDKFGDNKYKVEMIEALDEGLSAYEHDEFVDLCRGPHIPHMGMVQAVKVMKTSGAYWRADAKNDQLTRIYGVSYPDKKMLSKYLRFLEEAAKRDHRLIGKQQKLYSFHQEGPGMPFYHPNGMIIWDELTKYWQECHKKAGYHQIKTPIMLTQDMWKTSGHWDNYRENMYTSEIDDKAYAIKPMNCPGGMLYYKEDQYSYRQFPLKIAEIGLVHRHEMSGALSGLFRVRCFHQDDAHIFMTPDQMRKEIRDVLDLAVEIYKTFGLDYHLELSTRPEKSIGTDEQWDTSIQNLKYALEDGGFDYVINEGDGAFYGPKIDIHVKDALGRTWQCGTIQLDMQMPIRFDLNYIAADGSKQKPIMIHRAIYGSFERFLGILVEHYAGKFPMWLSPKQVKILAINDQHSDYALKVCQQFKDADLRTSVDISTESINKKVRQAQLEQVNYIIVVGDREVADGTLTVRAANKVVGTKSVSEIIEKFVEEKDNKSDRLNTI